MISANARRISLILKCVTVLSAVVGVVLSYAAGARSFMGGSRVFMFFTIQSNILIALIYAAGAVLLFRGRHVGNAWYVIQFVGTVSITLTGIVFCFVLAPTLSGAAWSPQNILTHVVVPVAALADFFVSARSGSIKKSSVLYVTLPPLFYTIYAGIGYAAGWQFFQSANYPYFFLNWGSPAGAFGFTDGLPFMGTGWWILAILLFLLAVGYGYLRILDRLKKNRGKPASPSEKAG